LAFFLRRKNIFRRCRENRTCWALGLYGDPDDLDAAGMAPA
jgi:hypothetical protein